MGFNRYAPPPDGPYDYEGTVKRLESKYRLSPYDASDLVSEARNSLTGMARFPDVEPAGQAAGLDRRLKDRLQSFESVAANA